MNFARSKKTTSTTVGHPPRPPIDIRIECERSRTEKSLKQSAVIVRRCLRLTRFRSAPVDAGYPTIDLAGVKLVGDYPFDFVRW
jgi:hypothetical protein